MTKLKECPFVKGSLIEKFYCVMSTHTCMSINTCTLYNSIQRYTGGRLTLDVSKTSSSCMMLG